MGIGVSLFLIAVGAVLTFAVETTADGININTVGIILMVVGALGFLVSLLFWGRLGAFGTTRTDRTVVREDRI